MQSCIYNQTHILLKFSGVGIDINIDN